jgi:hypothetical protein
MQVSLNACCVGGPIQEQSPVSPTALFILAAIYGAGALIVFAVTAAFL